MTGEQIPSTQVGLLNDTMERFFAEFQKLNTKFDELIQKVDQRSIEPVRGRPLRRPSVDVRRGGKDIVSGSGVPINREDVEGFDHDEEEDDGRTIVQNPRPRVDDNLNTIKQKIPQFLGKHDPDAYIAWEEHMNRIFDLHNYSEGKKVKLAVSEFHGYAST